MFVNLKHIFLHEFALLLLSLYNIQCKEHEMTQKNNSSHSSINPKHRQSDSGNPGNMYIKRNRLPREMEKNAKVKKVTKKSNS